MTKNNQERHGDCSLFKMQEPRLNTTYRLVEPVTGIPNASACNVGKKHALADAEECLDHWTKVAWDAIEEGWDLSK